MAQMREKRHHIRWTIQRPVRFKFPEQEEETVAILRDVSFSGARISLMESLRLNERLDLAMEIPDEENPILTQAKVVWQDLAREEGKPHFFCGLSFTKIKEADKEKIYNYIRKK